MMSEYQPARGSPPSTYAIARVYEGDPGGWPAVAFGTLQRSLFLLPGLWVAGVRGQRFWLGGLLGSASITASLFVLYGLRRAQVVAPWEPEQPRTGRWA